MGILQNAVLAVTRSIRKDPLYVLLLTLAAQFDAAGAFIPVEFFGAKGNGTTDDSAAVQKGYDLLHGTGVGLSFGDHTYFFGTAGIDLKTGNAVPIKLSAGTVLHANLTSGLNAPSGVLFFAPVTTAGATTLAAGVALGDESVTMTNAAAAGVVVGSNFFILSTDGASAMQYTAIAVAGNVVTTDRAILRTFPNGSAVTVVTGRCENFLLLGNGGTVTGNCFRFGELDQVWRAYMENVRFSDVLGYATAGAWSFDTATFEATVARCKFNGPSGIAFESNEGSVVFDSEADAHGTIPANSTGFYMSDCTSCRIVRCDASRWHGAGSGAGCILTTQGVLGCLDVEVLGCTFQGDNGISVAGARIAITNCNTPRCSPGAGLLIQATTGITITSHSATDCASGVSSQTSFGIVIHGIDVSRTVNVGIDCNSDTVINGLVSVAGVAGTVARATNCRLVVTDFDVTISGNAGVGTPFAFVAGATSTLRAAHGVIHLNATAPSGEVAWGTTSATGKLILDDVSHDGTGTPGQLFIFSTAALSPVRHKRLRWAAAGFNTAIAGQSNRGTAVLGGGTGTSGPIAFTDLQPDDFVHAQLRTAGGVLGFLSVALTVGTGFVINSSNAADTSTIEYEVTG